MMKKIIPHFVFFLLIGIALLYLIPVKTKSFFELYSKEDAYSESLKYLRAQPLKSIKVDGVNWSYYLSGKGEKCIVFIHGMGGTYDFWWNQLSYFEKDYRVISYTLPEEINSLKKAEKGILAILKHENIDKFIPVGSSMGGYITQYLVNNHPDKILKAVYGNTFPPNDFIVNENKLKRKFIPLLPNCLASKFILKHFDRDIFPSSENSELLKAFLLSEPFNKKSVKGRFDVVVDYFVPTPERPETKSIPKLIFESDNDPMITLELRKQLKAVYPEAKVYTFHNKGHFPYINAAEEYNNALKQFLENLK